jgi:hypothetical protein
MLLSVTVAESKQLSGHVPSSVCQEARTAIYAGMNLFGIRNRLKLALGFTFVIQIMLHGLC